jgi:hypothetical protein
MRDFASAIRQDKANYFTFIYKKILLVYYYEYTYLIPIKKVLLSVMKSGEKNY